MKDRLQFISHQEKDILLVDFSQCSKPEMLALLDQVEGHRHPPAAQFGVDSGGLCRCADR